MGREEQLGWLVNLGFVEKSELGTLEKDIAEIERMLNALIKSLEKKPLDPRTLLSNLRG
jgi:hypothetical protein